MAKKGDGDKRKVSTDALDTLGTIINENEKRDAIHLAVEPMQARTNLWAGDRVNAKGGKTPPHVGIVDPFLEGPVNIGEWFWLVIFPREIHSLRHVWTHPAFDDVKDDLQSVTPQSYSEEDKAKAEAWIRGWVDRTYGPEYETLMDAIEGGNLYDEYLTIYGQDAHGEIPDELWDKVEIVTGKRFDKEGRPKHFSCSC